jgi:anti-sigma factor RsiW
MTAPLSPHELELLSAHLDGQLSPAEREALLARLENEPALTAAFKDLQRLRSVLRRAPQRRLPRQFMLSPAQAGAAAARRGWSGFNFASALAALALLFVLATDFSLNGLPSAPAAEPVLMMAEAPAADSAAGGLATGNAIAESQVAEEAQARSLEATADEMFSTDEAPSLKTAPAPTLTGWVAAHASDLEALLASLAVIAGLLAWHQRRR